MSKEKQSVWAIWLIHGLCLILMLGTVYTGYRYSSHEYFKDALTAKAYEDSAAFGSQMSKDVRNAIRYSRLEEKFETNGSLDLNKVVQTVSQEDGTEKSYTLQNALDYGLAVGVYFDENKHLVVGKDSESEETSKDEEKKDSKEWRLEQEEALRNGDFDATFASGTSGDNVLNEKTVLLSLLYQMSEYYQLQKYLGVGSSKKMNFCYRFIFMDTDGEMVISTNADSTLTSEGLSQYGRYFSITSETGRFWSNLPEKVNEEIFNELEYRQLMSGGTYEILAAVDTSFPQMDPYQRGQSKYQQFVRLIRLLLILGGMLTAGLLASFVALIFQGRQEMKGFDLWYTEFAIFGEVLMLFVLYWGITEVLYGYSNGYYLDVVTGEVLFALAYFPAILGILSLIRRIRNHRFVSNFMSYQVAESLRESFRNRNDRWRSGGRVIFLVLFQLGTLLVTAGTMAAFCRGNVAVGVFLLAVLLLMSVWYILGICRRESQQKRILERVESLASGEVGRKLPLGQMTGDMRRMAQTVNSLDDSLDKAVQERTRSERMKTDLIANVSHDLRTPLTSIINYVDLLERENIPNPRVQDYLHILEDKAARLKTMAEALMDASRASSGNLSISWERIDMVQMLNQVLGEFQEKMEAAGLEPVIHFIDPPAIIMADGRVLWRVLDNLYTNTCKYAQPGTRVYIDLQETAHSLIYTMKNVSANPLNVPAEELTERFIRGDVSRSTEGSGLGLSIAKSMTEQLHGKFELFLDGDYFRVRLVFPMADEEETEK